MPLPPAPPSAAGYSGTPLAKKLGIVAGAKVSVLGAHGALPADADYRALVAPWPTGASLVSRVDASTDVVHCFVRERVQLEREAARLRRVMRADAVLWISWPKKAAKVETDITEDVIREVVLPMGWVDVKVCAVDALWSGLKLVVRKELRA